MTRTGSRSARSSHRRTTVRHRLPVHAAHVTRTSGPKDCYQAACRRGVHWQCIKVLCFGLLWNCQFGFLDHLSRQSWWDVFVSSESSDRQPGFQRHDTRQTGSQGQAGDEAASAGPASAAEAGATCFRSPTTWFRSCAPRDQGQGGEETRAEAGATRYEK